MRTVWRILVRAMLAIFGLLVVFAIGVFVFMQTSPQFGQVPTKAQVEVYESLDHFNDGVFNNNVPTSMDVTFAQGLDILKKQLNGTPNGEPDFEVPIKTLNLNELNTAAVQVVWFGHSAFLVTIAGKTLLLDPMMGDVPAPVSFMGPQRFTALPLPLEQIPAVDAIFISHDHYDHLDYESIKALNSRTKHFYVPLGVEQHFRSWGIESERITELDWWQEAQLDELNIAFTPSRHFSGRGFERNQTLWGSWVLQADSTSIYFSGDGGYGPHFKEIGKKYGPFDLALMECGQYNELWAQIHMMPEETAQAAVDVKAKVFMPIHWGAFKLALHAWTDPIERVTKKANQLGAPWIAPQIGQIITLNKQPLGFKTAWWQQVKRVDE